MRGYCTFAFVRSESKLVITDDFGTSAFGRNEIELESVATLTES